MRNGSYHASMRLGVHVVHFIQALPLGFRIIVHAQTDSMAPTIQKGQEFSIMRVSPKDIHIGDIMAYTGRKQQNILVHRVIGKLTQRNKILFETKGDNLQTQDVYQTPQKFVIGIVLSLSQHHDR